MCLLVNVDAKSLEWVTYLQISQDKTGIDEWHNVIDDPAKHDIHLDNQLRFNLPSRLIAKVFLFRWIYRGPAFAYASDPDFMDVSKDRKYWQDVIDSYYKKYKGIYKIHIDFIREVNATGKLTNLFGREFHFNRYKKGDNYEFSEYEITNYPNQSLGAEVMAVARVSASNRFRKYNLKSNLISTIHDSLTADCPENEVQSVKEIFTDVFTDLPKNISKVMNVNWNLPMLGEVTVGPNMYDLN